MRVPSTTPPYRRKETGDAKSLSRPPAPPPLWGRGTLRWPNAETNLQRHAHEVSGGRARFVTRSQRLRRRRADSALRDPARDATPSGTPRCKNAGTNVHAEARKARSNPADAHGSTRKIFLRRGGMRWPSRGASTSADAACRSRTPLPIPLRLFPPPLLAVLGRPIPLARLPTPPASSRLPTRFTAIMRSRMPRPEQPFASFEQTMPATEKSRRRRFAGPLRRDAINGILKRAQGRSCSQRSVSEASCCSLRDASSHHTTHQFTERRKCQQRYGSTV